MFDSGIEISTVMYSIVVYNTTLFSRRDQRGADCASSFSAEKSG